MACIIYWQAKEISRVILEGEPEAAGRVKTVRRSAFAKNLFLS